MALHEMRRVSAELKHNTTWIRVIHSGYGPERWRQGIRDQGFFLVGSLSAAEGTYVQIPPRCTVEEVIQVLTDINISVRRSTRYKEMNRSNKSRLQFKCEPFTVSLNSDEKPVLVRTKRFQIGDKDDD
jgi:hypothetical protein